MPGSKHLKKRLYWQKVQKAIQEKKDNRKYDTRALDFASESPEVESDSVTIDVNESEFAEYKELRVTLVYGDDYEAVRNLPRRRVRKTTRKRVGSWARKAFIALVTSLAALTQPCVRPTTGPRSPTRRTTRTTGLTSWSSSRAAPG